MAQSSALREQPSMDEILASIRKIIDAGEGKTRRETPFAAKSEQAFADRSEPEVTVPPSPANDARGKVSALPQAMPRQEPRTAYEPENKTASRRLAFDTDILSAVDEYLESEREKSIPKVVAEAPQPETIEPAISEAEAVLNGDFDGLDRELLDDLDRDLLKAERQAKYDARFTQEDSGAFEHVASVLRGTVEGELSLTQDTDAPSMTSLVSRDVSESVSHSFADLTNLFEEKSGRDLQSMATDLLRPMLQEWLDNNLPSLVERLVRAEIERIARGEQPARH